jgi:hypothetical protein
VNVLILSLSFPPYSTEKGAVCEAGFFEFSNIFTSQGGRSSSRFSRREGGRFASDSNRHWFGHFSIDVIREKCDNLRYLFIVSFHTGISRGMSWRMIRLFENGSVHVSNRDMWHESAADRLRYPRLLFFCQFLLPMGKYSQNYRFMNLEDMLYHIPPAVSPNSALRNFRSVHPARSQLYTHYFKQWSRIRTRHTIFQSTVKLLRGMIYFLKEYSIDSAGRAFKIQRGGRWQGNCGISYDCHRS